MYYKLLEVEGEKSLQGYLAQSQYEENRPDKKGDLALYQRCDARSIVAFAVQTGTLQPWMLCRTSH
jgi:hypothetical protein